MEDTKQRSWPPGQWVIRSGWRTFYFQEKVEAEKFLEGTKSWKVEEWTAQMEEKKQDDAVQE